jgi:hypothetical protein
VDGWVDGWESGVKDCLQQSKKVKIFKKVGKLKKVLNWCPIY